MRDAMEQDPYRAKKVGLGLISGVYIPVCLNIVSILMFLRFGLILGRIGLLGILGLLVVAYLIDFVTTLSLSAIASNGEVKGGGAYYLISRSLGPEFGGSIGILFYMSQVLNTALNVVGLIDCIKLSADTAIEHGYWWDYLFGTIALVICTALCMAGSGIFAKANSGLLVVLVVSILSIPLSALFKTPFKDDVAGIEFTGISADTLASNLMPHASGKRYQGLETFRDLFGVLFPATSGILAGASMSGDLRNPSKSIPKGTLWATLTTFVVYLVVILSMAASITHSSLLKDKNIIQNTNLWGPLILAGEFATTFFSALMGIIAAAKLLQALARDKLLPGLAVFSFGTKKADEPIYAILLTYAVAQVALLANLNQIATLISMGYQMTFFVMNLACFLLKIGSAPNFRPAFKFFHWYTAFVGSIASAAAMFFIDDTYAATAICLLVFLFLLIHYLSPPKRWGDVSQNLIYHQVRKYLLRLKPEHIKFWRPQIILFVNNPRRQTRLIQFCNSLKKGSLYILGHVIVTDNFTHEPIIQQAAWTRYIEFSRIKAFVQLTMAPSVVWGCRNLIIGAGLGGLRPNIAVLGFYNLDELRERQPRMQIPSVPTSPVKPQPKADQRMPKRRRRDTSAQLMAGSLPTDVIETEDLMPATSYLTILEDLALKYRLNVAVAKGFDQLETPQDDDTNTKKYIDLWPIQMSAEIMSGGKNMLTTNFDTYTLILQLGYILHSVRTWKRVYKLRILVFVEYESEVEHEKRRLKALLEKLRIDAEVLVFWLASGQLKTYQAIIQGSSDDTAAENLVNDCLRNEEWWEDLQRVRGLTASMTTSQDLAQLADKIDATGARPPLKGPRPSNESIESRRRQSVAGPGLPKKPTMSTISRLGVNLGIHTQNLSFDQRLDSYGGVDDGDRDIGSSSSGSSSDEFSDIESIASDGNVGHAEPEHEPLLRSTLRRKSHGDLLQRPLSGKRLAPARRFKAAQRREPEVDLESAAASSSHGGGPRSPVGSYGTLVASQLCGRSGTASARDLSPVGDDRSLYVQSATGSRTHLRSLRPAISRTQSGPFSSRVVPETVTTDEPSGSRIMFAEPEPRSRRPTFDLDGPASRRPSSAHNNGKSKIKLNMPELVESYKTAPTAAADGGKGDEIDADDGGSTYSTQGMALSFNDLPSRAQILILNELIRSHSGDTAVILTTLPIPVEGTCLSEEASVRYLSDVEILCNDLPPVLLVLSNHMTVTVSL